MVSKAMRKKFHHYSIGLILSILLAVFGLILWKYDPRSVGFYPKCPSLAWFGLYCGGCGMLRGVHQLLHGQVLEAVRYNVLILILPILAILYWRFRRLHGKPVVFIILIGFLVLFTVLRNIPYHPFLLLAPENKPAPRFSSNTP